MTRLALLVPMVLLGGAVTACSSRGDAGPISNHGDGSTTDTIGSGGTGGAVGGGGTSPSVGCSSGSKPPKAYYTITVGSTERGYALVPSTTTDPVPLVLEFHDARGDGIGVIYSFGLDTSLGGKVVLIAPYEAHNGRDRWATGNDSPDIDLVKALIERATQDHCIDMSRIYAVGAGWGGWMATQTACALGSTIAGFASVAGGGPIGDSCAGPVAGMVVHGMDSVEPIATGIATRDRYKTIDGCDETLAASTVAGCQQYSGCARPLLWCQHDGIDTIRQFVNDRLPKFFALWP
jgi:poly(3-hydroxybutyrate) depolymerase